MYQETWARSDNWLQSYDPVQGSTAINLKLKKPFVIQLNYKFDKSRTRYYLTAANKIIKELLAYAVRNCKMLSRLSLCSFNEEPYLIRSIEEYGHNITKLLLMNTTATSSLLEMPTVLGRLTTLIIGDFSWEGTSMTFNAIGVASARGCRNNSVRNSDAGQQNSALLWLCTGCQGL
jgi:hypothetical protein